MAPSEFTTFEFPISNYFNFQNFVRSRRDSKEKLPGRVPTPEAVDMNGRFQMQGGKNWFLPKETVGFLSGIFSPNRDDF